MGHHPNPGLVRLRLNLASTVGDQGNQLGKGVGGGTVVNRHPVRV